MSNYGGGYGQPNPYGQPSGYGQGGYGGQQSQSPYAQPAANPYAGSGAGGGYPQQSNPYSQQSNYGQPAAQSGPYGGQQSGYGQPAASNNYGGRPQRQQPPQQSSYAPQSQSYGQGGSYNRQEQSTAEAYQMGPMGGSTGAQSSFDNNSPESLRKRAGELTQIARAIGGQVEDLQRDYKRAVNVPDPSTNDLVKAVDKKSAEIMAQCRNAAGRILTLSRVEGAGAEGVKEPIAAADKALKKAVHEFQVADAGYQRDLRDQIKRQYRIARPDATESEVNEAAEDTSQQVFSQALLQSDRTGQARSTLSAVTARHEQIQKLEKQMNELADLFIEVNTIVTAQEEQVQQIDQQATVVEQDVAGANVELAGAVTKARAARRKKWICLGIVVAILVVIAIIIAIVVVVNNPPKKSS